MSDVIRLPDLHERFWQGISPHIRAGLAAAGGRPEAIDWAVADLERRCKDISIEFRVPSGVDKDAMAAALSELYTQFVSAMAFLEMDLWSARHP